MARGPPLAGFLQLADVAVALVVHLPRLAEDPASFDVRWVDASLGAKRDRLSDTLSGAATQTVITALLLAQWFPASTACGSAAKAHVDLYLEPTKLPHPHTQKTRLLKSGL